MRASLFRPAGTVLSTALFTAVALFGTSAPASATDTAGPRYYLALGDSLAAGYQTLPGGGHVTGRGYAQDIARTLAARASAGGGSFGFVGLGCPGETTGSMIDGGCPYPHSYADSQLAEAETFLRTHHDARTVVTLDIGANDVDRCMTAGNIDVACTVAGIGKVRSGLDTILDRLKAAAGPRTRIVGMNLYDPYLAAWMTGSQGRSAAALSVPLGDALNATIGLTDALHGIPTADVAAAFRTNSFLPLTPLGGQQVPLNVARILQWTNMARGDIHANDTGYQVIADTFLKKF